MINIKNLNKLLLFSFFNISVIFIFLQKKNIITQKYFSLLVKNIKTKTDSITEDKSVQTDLIIEDKSVQTDLIIENKEIQTDLIIMNNSVYDNYYDIIDEEGNIFVIL